MAILGERRCARSLVRIIADVGFAAKMPISAELAIDFLLAYAKHYRKSYAYHRVLRARKVLHG